MSNFKFTNLKVCLLWFFLFALGASPALSGPVAELEIVASGLAGVADLANAGDGSNRLFAAVREGAVRVIRDGDLLAVPFLDIRHRVDVVGEGGLVGLAFHPQFQENGRFFVAYTAAEGDRNQTFRLIVAEYRGSAQDPDRAATEEKRILTVDQPSDVHQGGDLAFGPDGFLYISSGDGGPTEDPGDQAQDLNTLLGKILRIDVDAEDGPYGIPEDNPFAGQEGVRGEIWAYGFRNPFRMGFDSETGRLFVGDVGQSRSEEVDLVFKGGNYGWPRLEGTRCFPETALECDTQGLTAPIHEYGRQDGGAVIGGLVYRGGQPTPLWGAYIFGDFLSGRIFALQEIGRNTWRRVQLQRTRRPVAFAEDEQGELYVADIRDGTVSRFRFSWREILSQVGDGFSPAGRFKTTFVVVNPHDADVEASLLFYDSDGEPAEVSVDGQSGAVHSTVIQAGSTRAFQTDGLSQPLFSGWAAIRSDRRLRASALLELSAEQASAGRPLIQTGVAGAAIGTKFLGPVIQRAENSAPALAVVNPSPQETLEFDVAVRHAGGDLLASRSYRLDPLQHLAFFLHEIAPLAESFEGSVQLESDRDMAPILVQTVEGVHAAQLPLEPRP